VRLINLSKKRSLHFCESSYAIERAGRKHLTRCGMSVDTGRVFKRAVLCPTCNEDYLFTLCAIADNVTLQCPACSSEIDTRGTAYQQLVAEVRATISSVR
jgi:hypothetical protein